jgi:hypothetical protein
MRSWRTTRKYGKVKKKMMGALELKGLLHRMQV